MTRMRHSRDMLATQIETPVCQTRGRHPGTGKTAGEKWRFLNTRFRDAFFNMAVDEMLLTSVARGEGSPTLRIYGWQPPALSFGYAQKIAREVDLERCRETGIGLVRRVTGGRAVLHWNELTYSVACREDDPLLGGTISETYHKISRCLVEGLRIFGVKTQLERSRSLPTRPRRESISSPCFSSTAKHEVTLQGRKLIGSAQRRLQGMILQHGSLLIGPEHKRMVDLLPSDSGVLREQFVQALDCGTIYLQEVYPEKVDFHKLGECLRQGFERCLDVEFFGNGLLEREKTEAVRLVREKYSTDTWNFSPSKALEKLERDTP